MELYITYIGALVVLTSYFAFFYMWFNSLHKCISVLDDKVSTVQRENVFVIKEGPMLEALAHLSRKIDQSIEAKSIPNTEDPREFFIKMGWDKGYIIRKKPRPYNIKSKPDLKTKNTILNMAWPVKKSVTKKK